MLSGIRIKFGSKCSAGEDWAEEGFLLQKVESLQCTGT